MAFGLQEGSAPDRFLVALAVLSLLAEAAEARPLVCLIEDAQWLDRASAQVLAFVARRLLAERIAMVFAVREPAAADELAGLPELRVEGLAAADARSLLESAMPGLVDARVRERILAETRGNPLALLELPRGLTPAELAGGFGLPDARPLANRIEQTFLQRVQALPRDTQRLLLTAAAEPLGDSSLLWRAAEQLGIGSDRRRPGRGRRADRSRSPRALQAPAGPLGGLPGRGPRATAATCTGRSRRRPTRSPIPTGARGTAPTRRRRPTRPWPPSWRARPIARSAAAAWRPPPRSSSGPPS